MPTPVTVPGPNTPTEIVGAAVTVAEPVRRRRGGSTGPRKPSAPKTIYAVVQVLGEDGEPIAIAKGKVRILSFEKSAELVLAKIDSGDFPHALYLSGKLPAGK